MLVKNNELRHIATSMNHEGRKYSALRLAIDEDSVRSELCWARGQKLIHEEDV